MRFKTDLLKYAAVGITLAASSPITQAAGYCIGNTATENISVSNMAFRGADADDCYGVVSGNDNASSINNIADNSTIDW